MSRSSSFASVEKTNCPTSAPARRSFQPPSQRDLEIYKQVRIQGKPQYEVAVDLGLHYSRVSQVIARVRRWLAAGGSPVDPQIHDHISRQRLALATHKLRLERAVEIAAQAMEHAPPVLKATRRRLQHGTELWRDETTRDQPLYDLGAVRLMLRATQALNELQDCDNCDGPPEEPASQHDLLEAVFDLLCNCRAQAEAKGRLPRSGDIHSLVAGSLIEILGTTAARACKAPLDDEPSPPQEPAQVPLNLSATTEASVSPSLSPATS